MMFSILFQQLKFKVKPQPVDLRNIAKSSAFKVQPQLSSYWRGF